MAISSLCKSWQQNLLPAVTKLKLYSAGEACEKFKS